MNSRYENLRIRQGYRYIIGCDEVGRGSLAGPVVAAAVVLSRDAAGDKLKVHKVYKVIKDSKLLTPAKRKELSEIIKNIASAWSIGVVSQKVVDAINIHNASLLAMKKAVEGLGIESHSSFLYVDGKFKVPNIKMDQLAVIAGDNKVLSIAAASIVAKVYRDNLMRKLDEEYPVYNFAQHKGYATEHHRSMIIKNGLSPIHRLSFCQNLAV